MESLIFGMHFFGECSRRLDVTVLGQKLRHELGNQSVVVPGRI